jgi:hypothetical protein
MAMSRHLSIARSDETPADWATNEFVPAELHPEPGDIVGRQRVVRQSRPSHYEEIRYPVTGGAEYHARGLTHGVAIPPVHLAKHGPWDTPDDTGIDW